MAEAIFGNTIGIGRDRRECFIYDKRRYCQTVLQTDPINFGITPDLCSGNLVTNGDFPSAVATSISWKGSTASTPINGWTWVSSGYLRHNTGNTSSVYQNSILTVGARYKINIKVGRYVSQFTEIAGTLSVYFGTSLAGTITASGDYTFYAISDDDYLRLLPTVTFNGYIDDIEIYELPVEMIAVAVDENGNIVGSPIQLGFYGGNFYLSDQYNSFEIPDGCYTICVATQCGYKYSQLLLNPAFSSGFTSWTPGPNWSISTFKAYHDPVGADNLVQDLSPWLLPGVKYTVEFTLSSYVGGSIIVNLGGTNSATFSSNGTYTFDLTTQTPLTHNEFRFIPSSNFDGMVDSVSVTMHIDSIVTDPDFCSDCLSLQTLTDDNCQMQLTWTNDDTGFNVPYALFGGTYINSLRVRAYLRVPEYDEDEEDFRSSSGRMDTLYFKLEKTKQLYIEPVPEYICDALSIAKGHDHFYISGVEYAPKPGFEPEFQEQPENFLTTVKLRVRKKIFLMENKNC